MVRRVPLFQRRPGCRHRRLLPVIEEQFETGYQEQLYLETQAVLAVYAQERITVYGFIQCPYYITDALLSALGWPEERIRVVQLPTGGGFGGKEEFPSMPAALVTDGILVALRFVILESLVNSLIIYACLRWGHFKLQLEARPHWAAGALLLSLGTQLLI